MQATVSDREQPWPMLASAHCWVGEGVCWPGLALVQGLLVHHRGVWSRLWPPVLLAWQCLEQEAKGREQLWLC